MDHHNVHKCSRDLPEECQCVGHDQIGDHLCMVVFHLKVHPVALHKDRLICKDHLEVLLVVHHKWAVLVDHLQVDLMPDQVVQHLMLIQHSLINLVEDHLNILADRPWQVDHHMDLPDLDLSKE